MVKNVLEIVFKNLKMISEIKWKCSNNTEIMINFATYSYINKTLMKLLSLQNQPQNQCSGLSR